MSGLMKWWLLITEACMIVKISSEVICAKFHVAPVSATAAAARARCPSRDGIPASWMNAVRTPFNQFGRALITAYPLLILSTTRLGTTTWTGPAERRPRLVGWPLVPKNQPLPSSFHSHLFIMFFGEWSRVRDNYWISTIRYEYRWAGSPSARVIASGDKIPSLRK